MHEGRVEQVDDARAQQRVGLSGISRGEEVVQAVHERLAGELVLQNDVVHVSVHRGHRRGLPGRRHVVAPRATVCGEREA